MRRFVHVRRQLTPLPLRTIGRALARPLVPWGTAGGRGAELETLTRATFHLFINALLSERGSERLSFITLFIYFLARGRGCGRKSLPKVSATPMGQLFSHSARSAGLLMLRPTRYYLCMEYLHMLDSAVTGPQAALGV